MRTFLSLLFFTLLAPAAFCAQAAAEDLITLNLPESVIAKASAAILPLQIDAHSRSIEGDITIIKISELQLTDNHLLCRLHLAGTNLAILTEMAGHEIRLKVGSVEVDFKTDAAIRFDAKKQTLYIRPVIKDVVPGSTDSSADIGQALVAVLDGREFPIALQKLEPLIARTGDKAIIIHTTIANIEAKPGAIQLSLLPAIGVE